MAENFWKGLEFFGRKIIFLEFSEKSRNFWKERKKLNIFLKYFPIHHDTKIQHFNQFFVCRSFETNVETVRGSVLANQKKLRMSEVEDMTEKLTNIGRLAANLKSKVFSGS